MEEGNETIALSDNEKNCLYLPWKYSVIVKLADKRISHQFLKRNLTELWNLTKNLILIDLGWDFFIAKFNQPENMQKKLHDGPWFILVHFLSVH